MNDKVPRRARGEDYLAALLREAGVQAGSAVRITGQDGLAPLIWLCRHGFDNVAYVRSGAGGPSDPGDVLLILHSTPPTELESLLAQRPALRAGGVLIIQTPHLVRADGADPIHILLERAGYCVERCIVRGAREVHVARRRETAQRRAA